MMRDEKLGSGWIARSDLKGYLDFWSGLLVYSRSLAT